MGGFVGLLLISATIAWLVMRNKAKKKLDGGKGAKYMQDGTESSPTGSGDVNKGLDAASADGSSLPTGPTSTANPPSTPSIGSDMIKGPYTSLSEGE